MRSFGRLILACIALCCFAGIAGGAAQAQSGGAVAAESSAQRQARMRWWEQARFGMFIHWGIYAVPARGEWYMNDGIPRTRYAEYARQFDPVKFDADRWAQLAHDAGQKYLVITSKHHDGFSMFDSGATDYTVTKATPWKQDPLKALSAACGRHGVRFCVYYSIMDWHAPQQLESKPDAIHPTYNPTRFAPGEKQAYVDYMKAQLKELVTGYHPAVIWFDGGWMEGWNADDGRDIYQFLRKLDPKIIVNNRVGGTGDYDTPEQEIPGTGLGRPWETCMTINGNWGFNSGDHGFKSTQDLLHNLIDIASKGGDYLLNVGPTAEGVIPQPEVDRLLEMGRWLRVNGTAIYGTSASPFRRLPWGRATRRGDTLYLHVFQWPADGNLVVPGLRSQIEGARLLAANTALTVLQGKDGIAIRVPSRAPDPISTTIALKFRGPLVVENPMLRPSADGSIALPASEATTHGSQVRYESGSGKDNLGYWTDPADWAEWRFTVTRAGRFALTAEIAALSSGRFELRVGGKTLAAVAPTTGDYTHFEKLDLGTIDLAAGEASLEVRPVRAGWQPMNLKSITLRPAP